MANTVFGMIEYGKGSDRAARPSFTFRLHIAHGINEADILPDGFPKEVVLRDAGTVKIHFWPYPSHGLIYEREFHVSKAKGSKGQDVLHLKEGSRFVEVGGYNLFLRVLGCFLTDNITGLAELVAR